ncbi:MAG: hypothetical protein HYZ50_25565 [Deltaproteobacteria bacterium]|nr:hypothetical protein [Deltaproteobacteria bacterium]
MARRTRTEKKIPDNIELVQPCGPFSGDCTGNDESIQTVDSVGGVGLYTSLVLDSNGFPVISYYGDAHITAGDLRVVHCNDPNCTDNNESIQTVAVSGIVGEYSRHVVHG